MLQMWENIMPYSCHEDQRWSITVVAFCGIEVFETDGALKWREASDLLGLKYPRAMSDSNMDQIDFGKI